MNIKQFRKKLTGKVIKFAPGPERRTSQGQYLGEFEYNDWFIEPTKDNQKKVAEFKNVHTDHHFELGFDSINQFREPHFLILRCKIIVVGKKIDTEPLLPSAGVDAAQQPTDGTLFQAQLDTLEGNTVDKIRTRGHWETVIRPVRFIQDRIPTIPELFLALRKASAHFRSTVFPTVGTVDHQPRISLEGITLESESLNHIQAWGFFKSGQFAHLAGTWLDWRDQAGWGSCYPGWQPNVALGMHETLVRFTDIFAFAARLACTHAGDDHMFIGITVHGLRNRRLFDEMPILPIALPPSKASIPQFPYARSFARKELIGDQGNLAAEATRDLFWRFNWDADMELLRKLQGSHQRGS